MSSGRDIRKKERKFLDQKLSQISHVWQLHDKSEISSSLDSLFQYMLELKANNLDLSISPGLKPLEVPYNCSLLHFILYYTYYPKYPFVIYEENTVIFGAFTGKNYQNIELSFSKMCDASTALQKLNKLLSKTAFKDILMENKVKKITLRDVDKDFVNLLKRDNEKFRFKLESLRELSYATYDIQKTLRLTGADYANLRWHLNSFKKDKHKIKVVSLDKVVKPVVHLIGEWRRKAIQNRGFSYVNLRSDKLGARLFGNISKTFSIRDFGEIVGLGEVISRVLELDGEVAAFNLGFPLGIFNRRDVFAHAIGISDVSVPHLAEYAQYDFWKEIKRRGYNYVNDGPTWKDDLRTYKNKFRPIGKKRYYWATLSLNF